MAATLDRATTVVNDLESTIETFPELSDDRSQIVEFATRVVRQGIDAVELIRLAHDEIEEQAERLDAVQQVVLSRIDRKIDEIYDAARGHMNGAGQEFDSLYEKYNSKRVGTINVSPALRKLNIIPRAFSVPYVRKTTAANAVLIGGILGGLVFSRYNFPTHASSFVGFLVGCGLVVLIQAIASSDRAALRHS